MPTAISRRQLTFHICCIAILFLALSLLHYQELLTEITILGKIFTTIPFGLSRHVLERFIYPLLVAYASWALGVKYGGVVWLASIAAMVSRALTISINPRDAFIESIAALTIGGLSIAFIEVHRRYQQQQDELEEIVANLRASEANYEELFNNASDAIWVHDLEGKIIIANRACEKLTGYSPSELIGKNVSQFLSPEALALARDIKFNLMRGEILDQRYEQHLIRKDKAKVIVELATSIVKINDVLNAFQNIARDITEERRLRDNLRAQIHNNLVAQEEERKRIARELHDDIAQSILLITRQLDMLVSNPGHKLSATVAGELESLYGIADDVYKSLQRYARDLRPSILDQMGLVPALSWLIEDLSNDLGINAEVKAGILPSLSSETELAMFRIAQEALNNVRKHAGASDVRIILDSDAAIVTMTITDNGEGFSMPKSTDDLVREEKLGLLGMQERAHLILGKLEIKSEPNKGTTIIVKVPV